MSGITKLIFAGLDKAGKTTIYKATMEEMDANELKNLAPTKQIERHSTSYLDRDFSVWDMGGQQNYREAYLSRPEVFNQTKAMIFVIDIQDIDRLEESYQYFVDILQILKNVDPAPKLYVLFHKYDPEISGRLKSHFYKAARLFRKADRLTPQKFKFYLTSIFSNSIDLAVKRILFENFEEFEEPSAKLTTTKDMMEEASTPTVPIPDTKKAEAPTPAAKTAPTVPQPTTSANNNLNAPTSPPTPTSPPAPTSSVPIPSKSEDKSQETFEVRTSVTTEKPKSTEPLKVPTSKAQPPSISATSGASDAIQLEKGEEPVKTEEEIIAEVKQVTDEDKEEVRSVTSIDKEELKEATPKSLFDLSDELVEKLTNIVDSRMKETEEIVALSILSTEGEQVLAIGKSDADYERLSTLKEVVKSLNPKQFYQELSDIEYRGLGHFTLSDFDIYFARANKDYAIAILAVDVSTLMLQNAQRIVDSIRQGLGMMDVSEEAEPEVEKKDLVSDLRSRLKKLSSLSDLDKE